MNQLYGYWITTIDFFSLLLLLHGAAGLESSGLLHTDKWQTNAEDLVDALLATVAEARRG